MTEHEKIQFVEMQEEIKEIHKAVNEVRDALVGNDISKDGGIVGRISHMEMLNVEVDKRIKAIEEANVRASVYIGLICALGSALVCGIISWAVNHV